MTVSGNVDVIQHLRRAVLLRDGAGMTDAQLLEQFLTQRDDDAFAALVRRHGAMVWGVCRRVLRNHHDAENAFQATFVVLLRKASTIQPKEMLPNWLYGVAHQTALKAMATTAKRNSRERQVAEMPERVEGDQDLRGDLQTILDEELSRLPDKFRVVIVLCYLEGKTRKEAARHLGCPEGTVGGWLARAREMLAKRLTRRGLAMSGGLLAAALSDEAVAACVPGAVLSATIKAASLLAAGQTTVTGATSVKVAALTKGILKAMLISKLNVPTAMILIAAIIGAGTLFVRFLVHADEPPHLANSRKPLPLIASRSRVQAKPVIIKEKADVRRLAFSADGNTLLTIGFSYPPDIRLSNAVIASFPFPISTIKTWDSRTGELQRVLAEEKNLNVTAFAVSPDRKTVALAIHIYIHSNDNVPDVFSCSEVRLMDLATWKLKRKVDTDGLDEIFKAKHATVSVMAFSPDGTTLALGGASSRAENHRFLKLWDVPNQKLKGGQKLAGAAESVKPNSGFGEQVSALAFSPDGKILAGGSDDGKLRLFDGQTGELRKTLEEDGIWNHLVAFLPDGKTLLSQDKDRKLKFWDIESAKVRQKLQGNLGGAPAAGFSPNGKFLATGGTFREDGTVKAVEVILWDAKSGERKHSFPDLTVPVSSLAFSPDGRTLATVGGTLGYGKDGIETSGEIRFIPLDFLRE